MAYIPDRNLYLGDWNSRYVFRCDASNGAVIGSFTTGLRPYGLAPIQTGDGGIGATYLYSSATSPSYFWQVHYTNGSILSSFEAPQLAPQDTTYDHRNQLIWRYYSDVVYGISTAGSVKASFPWSGRGTYVGMAYYGEYLFIGGDVQPSHIYIVHCPGSLGVAPASMGKIKAMFE